MVDPKEVAAMAALQSALNNVENGKPVVLPQARVGVCEPNVGLEPFSHPRPDAAAMKLVLSKFYDSIGDVIADTVVDTRINQAIETKKIPQGLQVKKYKILVNEIALPKGGVKKSYSIQHQSGDVLFENLQVGAAAIKLVELLNVGKKINSQEVLNILHLEEKYSSFRAEAIRYKQLWKQAVVLGKTVKCDIYEAKYQNARQNALRAKRDLEILADVKNS